MAVLMSVFQSLSKFGEGSRNLVSVFFFGPHYPTVLAKTFDREMVTRRLVVRPVHMHGFRIIALMYLSHNYTDLRCQQVKLLHVLRTFLFSVAPSNIYDALYCHTFIVSFLHAIPVTSLAVKFESGRMLSATWTEKHQEISLRSNFFRSLSRILLSITRIPLPKIGSFTIDNNGYLHLGNRPLSLEIHELENERVLTDILRDCAYTTVGSYVLDILQLHDSRLRN
ncbi:hypothetical protein AJ80_09338 [Polytolypa hystricis UAMH7299]|uniref:Uncharacterized protein n=1 Tax=Polytolypa hystricis (strain UAMH7299) TaxID=1447883 RepID=A0A2B7WSY6_POLH7|nr:hypothetical protein AJ80_09338 [Polytolypa hystricis UAMH7299]